MLIRFQLLAIRNRSTGTINKQTDIYNFEKYYDGICTGYITVNKNVKPNLLSVSTERINKDIKDKQNWLIKAGKLRKNWKIWRKIYKPCKIKYIGNWTLGGNKE